MGLSHSPFLHLIIIKPPLSTEMNWPDYWLLGADIQRRAQIGLNKGEAHHAL